MIETEFFSTVPNELDIKLLEPIQKRMNDKNNSILTHAEVNQRVGSSSFIGSCEQCVKYITLTRKAKYSKRLKSS